MTSDKCEIEDVNVEAWEWLWLDGGLGGCPDYVSRLGEIDCGISQGMNKGKHSECDDYGGNNSINHSMYLS